MLREIEPFDGLPPEGFSEQVLVLPLSLEDGCGIYDSSVTYLVKELRAAGIEAAFLHPPSQRRWRKLMSAEVALEFALAYGPSLMAIADSVLKIAFGRFWGGANPSEVRARFLQESQGPDGSVQRRFFEFEGDAEAFGDALTQLAPQVDEEARPETGLPPTAEPVDAPRPNGNDSDARLPQRALAEEHGLQRLRDSKAAREQSRRASDETEAERSLRTALDLAYGAFNWLEDTKYEDEAHEVVHELGREALARFPAGCRLVWTGSRYEHQCPVELTHRRIGFSPGMIVRARECSVCGEDPSECEHRPGMTVEVRGGPNSTGRCPVCGKAECEHSPDEVFEVRPSVVITQAELQEISLVHRPLQPDARLTGIPVGRQAVEQSMGPHFQFGEQDVYCSQCSKPCQGFVRFPGDPRLGEQVSEAREDA